MQPAEMRVFHTTAGLGFQVADLSKYTGVASKMLRNQKLAEWVRDQKPERPLLRFFKESRSKQAFPPPFVTEFLETLRTLLSSEKKDSSAGLFGMGIVQDVSR
ncbi:MAG: hypothetical protein LLG04_13270 [Parachlamydia sp.]|nr:hypothetical protein [Parachlamydia sp.]